MVGFKPSYGRVSRYGLLAFASSLDQIGPFATSVADAALAFGVIAGHDPRDSTSVPPPADAPAAPDDLHGLRIGVPRALLGEGVDDGVLAAFDAALETMRDRGATIVDVALPHTAHAIPVYYIVATAEASSNLARYDGVRYGMRVEGATLAEMYERTAGQGSGAR